MIGISWGRHTPSPRLLAMHHNRIAYLVLMVGWLFGPVSTALAHDPGLSRATARVSEQGLFLRMVFATQDIQMLVPADLDRDRTVSAQQFAAIQDRVKTLVGTQVLVRQGDEPRLPIWLGVEPVQDDAVSVVLRYDISGAESVLLQIPLIGRLARGHRQYLRVEDKDGSLTAQHILDGASPPISLTAPGRDGLAVFRQYLSEGVRHICNGLDHILFLLTLLLPAVLVCRASNWEPVDRLAPATAEVLKVITAFTIAHSLTLGLAVLDIVVLPSGLVEPVIALSVLITAVNNLRPQSSASRWLLAFVFGLVHGFGFAGVLLELDLPRNALMISLLGFNLGVEVGQLAMLALVFPVIAFLRSTKFYQVWVFRGGSAVTAVIAMVWMIERMFDYEVLGF